jgi:16S rRNA (guanine1516-N2)-methyltransferase
VTVQIVDTADGKALIDDAEPTWKPVRVDVRQPRVLRKEDALIKAVGVARLVVDATAGLGRDALALWRFGHTVIAIERSPVVAALWTDALQIDGPLPRCTFVHADARAWLASTTLPVDVVLIDAMYEDAGRSALQQKEMRLLRSVVGDDNDVNELIAVARRRARIVKKSPHAGRGKSTVYERFARV